MAPLVLTPDEETAAMEAGSSELKFLFGKENIDRAYQAKFFHVGILSVAKFGSLVRDQDELRRILKEDIGLDADAGLASRVQVASFICAYRNALTRTEEVAKYEGEQEARQMPKSLPQSEFLAMKNAYEAKWWKMEDVDIPARTFMEKRAEELESGELKAESLTSVLCREQDEDDFLQPVWDISGQLKVKKSSATTTDPENPEQFRRRIGISFNAIILLGLRHTNRPEIQGVTPQLAPRYCEYMLGEHVWGLVAKDPSGYTISAPTWNLILAYDMAIRKKAYRLMSDGAGDFSTCMKSAWMDSTTKERYFTTPMAIAASTGTNVEISYNQNKRLQGSPAGSSQQGKWAKSGKTKGKKGGGKGGGAGKGKGKGKGPSQCASHTPDGKAICYSYNNSQVRCTKQDKCNFLHVCGRCFQKHPLYQCAGNKSKAPETGGQGLQSD
jgi:hypothetical protein